jgi:PilZ domain
MLARSRESRKSLRRWMRRDAHIVFKTHGQPIRCVVRDLSHGGARLSFTVGSAALPNTFTLVLFKDSIQRDCEMVWTDGRFVGVRFTSQWSGTKPSERVPASKETGGSCEPKPIT